MTKQNFDEVETDLKDLFKTLKIQQMDLKSNLLVTKTKLYDGRSTLKSKTEAKFKVNITPILQLIGQDYEQLNYNFINTPVNPRGNNFNNNHLSHSYSQFSLASPPARGHYNHHYQTTGGQRNNFDTRT